MQVDTLIIGQGLAGSLLAWELISRGKKVLVVDRDDPVTSSKVAAGIVTPITGQRLVKSWRLEDMLENARGLYDKVEKASGETLFHPAPIARLLASETEAERWRKRLDEQDGALPDHAAPLEIDEALVHAELGGFEMPAGGWLDVPAFLEAMRQFLLERLGYAIADVHAEEIQIGKEGIRWRNVAAEAAVFCQGWEGNRNRFFDWVEFRNAKGQVFEGDCEALAGEGRVLNRSGWLIPLGRGRFRAGATYEWDFPDSGANEVDENGRESISEKVKGMLKAPFELGGGKAAVRPIIRESKALIGSHPDPSLHRRICFFNGLGSKGVLNGPLCAKQLAEHLVDGTPIEDEIDLRRNL